MKPEHCPECDNILIKHPKIWYAMYCKSCCKGWIKQDLVQWIEIFPESELDDVVAQARKLVNK